MLKLLLDKRPDMIDVKNDDGESPLFYAAAQNGEFFKNKQLIIFKILWADMSFQTFF